jgi:hypothetical protein
LITPSLAITLTDRQLEFGRAATEAMRASSPPTDTPPLDEVAPALRAAAAAIPARRPVRSLPIERLSLD